MKPKTSFEIYRWTYYVVLWAAIMGVGIVLVEYVIGPVMQWIFDNQPYQFPTWSRIGRLTLYVLFMGVFAGSLSWLYEKKTSGR